MPAPWDDAMAAADAVTKTVEEDGFATYLDQLGLLDRSGPTKGSVVELPCAG